MHLLVYGCVTSHRKAANRPDAVSWRVSMGEGRKSLVEHDVFEWVHPPGGAELNPSGYLFRWKYIKEGIACRKKVQGGSATIP